MVLFLAATLIVLSGGTSQATFQVTNDVLDVSFEEDRNYDWRYQYQPVNWVDCCYHEHFGVRTQEWGETVASDGIGTPNSFAVTQHFQVSPDGRTATAKLGYDGLEVTRRIHLDPGGVKHFTITYTLKNVGQNPLPDVRFFETVDYDVGGLGNDYGVYEPGADNVWVNDENYYKCGFGGSTPSSHHGVDEWYPEICDDWDDGQLNDMNRWPAVGTDDVGVGLQWNVGNLGLGDTAEITITFFFGEPPFKSEGPWVRKTADRKTAKPGEEINYTITISNNGTGSMSDVVVEDVFNRDVDIISVSPPPDGDGLWRFPEILPGDDETITLTVKTPEDQDFDFGMDQAVSGDGFVNVESDYSTAPPAYILANCVYVSYNTSCGKREMVSDCESVTVGEAGTELSAREHGSGTYDSEETLKLLTENKSIEMKKDVSATYAPTTLGLYRNRTVAFSSKWTEEARAKNYVTGTTMTETYHDAARLDRESRMFLDKNESVMVVDSEFDGRGHVGFLKMPSNTSTPQTTPLFEATEDYAGSFKVLERIDEYGSAVSSEKAASGTGQVVVDKRVGSVQRSYESGSGSYDSEELIETSTNYIAKDISLVYAPTSQRLTGDVSLNSSMKWKEGMYSKNPRTSYIGEEYTSITELEKETVAKGLREMETSANFSGRARYRAVKEDEVDFDEEYDGDYSVERRVIFTGVAKYDRPHLNVTKTLEGIVEETLPWGYNETHLAGATKTRKVATYNIAIENDGNKALGPVYVQDLFPPGSIYIGASLRPSELKETYANWTLLNLGIGDVVNINLKLDVTKYHPSELVNRVEVCGGINNGDEWICATNFSALEIKWLTCCTDETLSVTKTGEVDPANESVVRYRIEIENSEDATRVATVTDPLPEGMKLVSSSVPVSSYDGEVVVWNLIEIPASGTKTIEFLALAPGNGRFTNTVEVDARSVDGPVVQPVYASCVIDVGVVEDECGAVSCGVWQPPNWELDHVGYQPDKTTCEDLTCTSSDGTESCLAP